MGKKKLSRTDILRICIDIEELLDKAIDYKEEVDYDKVVSAKTKIKEIIDNI